MLAAIYGAVAATLGLIVGRGNPFWALVVMIVLGGLFRLWASIVIRRRGHERPKWWRWL